MFVFCDYVGKTFLSIIYSLFKLFVGSGRRCICNNHEFVSRTDVTCCRVRGITFVPQSGSVRDRTLQARVDKPWSPIDKKRYDKPAHVNCRHVVYHL